MDAPAGEAPAYPFHVAVAAPPWFSHLELARHVGARLSALTVRVRWRQPVRVYALIGEPVCAAAGEAGERYGWHVTAVAARGDRPDLPALLRTHVHLAATVDALVIFHGPGEPPADLTRLADSCRWLGTPVRTVRVEPARQAGAVS